MKEKLLKLIQKSSVLDEASKKHFSELANSLNDEQTKKLYEILLKGEGEMAALEKNREEKKSEIDKRYLEELKKTVKKEEKEIIQEEEEGEKNTAENILKQL